MNYHTKSRRRGCSDLLDLNIDSASGLPLARQIYLGLRNAIMSGAIPSGTKVPSSRELSKRLSVSRTSVVNAFEQLLVEGYIVGVVGAGTYVSDDIPKPLEGSNAVLKTKIAVSRPLSRLGEFHRTNHFPRYLSNVPFNTGFCGVDARSVDAIRRISAREMRILNVTARGYSDPSGLPSLRDAIAEYLRVSRAVRCEPDQIVITSGAQQGLDLVVRLTLDPGDEAWIEDPCYPFTRATLESAGVRCRPVPVDQSGMVVTMGARFPDAKAAFVTPSHQYPLGVAMTMARRLELLAWAGETGGWIVEDDYDSEFRYGGRPLASLQGLDQNERVIYVGTFSKVLFPGLRLGFLVLPRPLVEAFTACRYLVDRNPPILMHSVIAEYVQQGHLVSHIRRMRALYREARDFVAKELLDACGRQIDVDIPDHGMHLVVRLRHAPDTEISARAAEIGVVTRPLSRLYAGPDNRTHGLMLGFTGYTEHQMRSAAAKLANVINNYGGARG